MATSLRPPAAIYREEQNFGWWVYALLAVMMALGCAGLSRHHGPGNAVPAGRGAALEVPLSLAVGLTLPAVLVIGVLRMTTEVTPTDVRVWFGWLPTIRRVIPLSTIEGVSIVRYRPIRDYWGWGVRRGPDGELALNARGDRGVRLRLADGSHILIGSQRPEALATALERAMHPEV